MRQGNPSFSSYPPFFLTLLSYNHPYFYFLLIFVFQCLFSAKDQTGEDVGG